MEDTQGLAALFSCFPGSGGGGGDGVLTTTPPSIAQTDDGTVYFYNEATQETHWEKPAELDQLERLAALQDAVGRGAIMAGGRP